MRRNLGAVIIALIVLLIIFGGAIIGFYTDWLWFKDLGFSVIFIKTFLTKVGLGSLMGLLFFAIIYGNLWYARRIAPPSSPMGLERRLIEHLGSLARRGIGIAIFAGSVIVSFMVGLEAATHWEEWLLYSNASKFGINDPALGRDIGFYVFRLPFINYFYGWLFFALSVALIASAALHYADEAIEVFGNRLQFAPKVKAHLAVLVAALFFLKAWGYRLAMFALLNSQGNQFDGAGYTDAHARIPALWILLVVAIIAGIMVLVNVFRRGVGLALAGLVGLVGMSVLVGAVYPALVEQFSVQPNEKDKESLFISRAIGATQQAYGLTRVAVKPFAANGTLSPQQIDANRATIQNIRLWDKGHLQLVYNQKQTLQNYYHFQDVDVDRYWLTDPATGKSSYRQVWLAAREMNQSELPQGSQTWVNRHLQYTHGYGLVMSPVNEVNADGLPTYFVKDIPPVTTVELPLTQMSTYFGELTTDYVFVDTSAAEFNYPNAQQTAGSKYQGNGGVPVGNFLRRIAWAIRFQDVNLLLNENIRSSSRILFQRDVDFRLRQALPFIMFDSDPYLVTSNGKLYWVRDGYTTTNLYPYSKQVIVNDRSMNYIRNSVKAVVDAYTGKIDAYIMTSPLDDPIIKTYARVFPGVLKPISQMPDDLRSHIRYPEDLFRIQTELYARWHYPKNNPSAFYNNSDLWKIPAKALLTGSDSNSESTNMEPYYVIMKLPGETSEEFILMTPYVRAGKRENMVSWVCAKCDAPDYGTLVLFQFPEQINVNGPSQVVSLANQKPQISSQLTLWNQPGSGSSVGSGNMLVIPIESSLLYVMPVYLLSESSQIPEIKQVIVALGDNISMQPTLEQALSDVVGTSVGVAANTGAPSGAAVAPSAPAPPGGKPAPSAAPSAELKQLITQASAQYNSALQAQKNGDWAEYGKQVKALKATLDQLKARSGK